MEIIQTKNLDYINKIKQLYIDAFASGFSEQYIDVLALENYVESLLINGETYLAIENELVLGAILTCPLKFDEYVPSIITETFQLEKCLYVAEMMVTENCRGQGIGKRLLSEFLINADSKLFTDIFIRVWDKNAGAVSLYKKMGFKPFTTIEQTKIKPDGKETFIMKKIYLHKKLDEYAGFSDKND